MIKKLKDKYFKYLESHAEQYAKVFKELECTLEKINFKYGDNVIPTILRPIFMPSKVNKEYARLCKILIGACDKVVNQCLKGNKEFIEIVEVGKKFRKLAFFDPGYNAATFVTRPDSFFSRGKIIFNEINSDSPGGTQYANQINYAFKQLAFTRKFLRKNRIKLADIPVNNKLTLTGLLKVFKEFRKATGYKRKKPTIAIVDWKTVGTVHEFYIMQRHFRKKGYKVFVVEPYDLKYDGKHLKDKKGNIIDIVYKRVVMRELVGKLGFKNELLKAYYDKNVCVANSFNSYLVSSKAVFEIFTSSKFKKYFSKREWAILKNHVPWTRKIRKEDKKLKTHMLKNKDKLVIKPTRSYGGRNVYIGVDLTQNEWQKLVAIIYGGKSNNLPKTIEKSTNVRCSWIVQQKIVLPKVKIPQYKKGKIDYKYVYLNINPYVFGGVYGCPICRASLENVINVAGGGGVLPLFVVK